MSPAITNIIMFDFDEKIGDFCEKKNIAYTRCCDDMTFSGDFDEREIISFVKDEHRGLGLFLKNRKTAVDLFTVPQEQELLQMMEEIQKEKEISLKIA